MKTMFTFALVTMLFFNQNALVLGGEIFAKEVEVTLSTDANYHYSDENFVVVGNYSSFDVNELKQITENAEKISIFYDLDVSDNENDNLEIMRNNAVVYYYKNGIPHVHSFKSATSDFAVLIEEIEDFVNEKIGLAVENAADGVEIASMDDVSFSTLYSGSFREVGKPYGYIDCDYVVSKYRANDVSSLYLIESHVAFTPGQMALDMNSSGYGPYYNATGFVKLKALRAENEVGYNQTRYGGTPVWKDAYPVNSPGKVTITSSYTTGFSLGYSFVNGFSADNVSQSTNTNMGANISYSYSKAYSNTEPHLSAQKNAEDSQQYEWKYTYSGPMNETHHMYLGYMFEMNNGGHDLLEGDLAFRYDYEMTVCEPIFDVFDDFDGYSYHNYY